MKFITLDNLNYAMQKVGSLFVKKELKTGSDTEYKGLSDNNLTDELVEKINNAGSATAVTENIATAKTEAITESKEYTDTTAETAKTEAVTESKSYTDTTAATAKTEAIESSNSYTDEQLEAAKTELQADINSKISTAYKVKGSSTFANLPALSEAEEGNVYNLTEEFTTTADFVEGEGQKYPAGTNIVCIEESEGVFKWDVLPGFIDTDTFVLNSDIETVTEDEIDAMFTAA